MLTLGLAYPFAQSRLERFKMRHTFFGNLPGRFEGSGVSLFLRGLLMWLFTVVPLIVGLLATIGSVNWESFAGLSGLGLSADELTAWIAANGIADAAVILLLTLIWTVLAVVILYPIFQTVLLRWWTSGLRFGDIVVTSRLSMAQVYSIYGRFLLYAFLFTLAAGTIGFAGLYAFGAIVGPADSLITEIAATAALLAGYVILMLGYSTIYQATVRLGLWRCVAESLVTTRAEPSPRHGTYSFVAEPTRRNVQSGTTAGIHPWSTATDARGHSALRFVAFDLHVRARARLRGGCVRRRTPLLALRSTAGQACVRAHCMWPIRDVSLRAAFVSTDSKLIAAHAPERPTQQETLAHCAYAARASIMCKHRYQ